MAQTLPLSIRTSTDANGILTLSIVDQLLLPHTVSYIPITTIDSAHAAIRNMQIRGAPAIASLAALSIASELSRALAVSDSDMSTSEEKAKYAYLASPVDLKGFLEPQLDFLYTSRPTAVNLGAAIRRLRQKIGDSVNSYPGASSEEEARQNAIKMAKDVLQEATAVADEDLGRNKEMSVHGAEWLVKRTGGASKLNVLTVCNTGSLATSGYGTALGLITNLFETDRLGTAYFTQTAPYHQGSRLTAFELQSMQAPHVMICDTMVGSLFQHHTIHAVVVGADRIAKNGDTANKIGTYNAAVLAARHNIPFVVVAPVSTVDLDIPDGSHIPIEQRPWQEACLVRGAVYPIQRSASDESAVVEQKIVQLTPPGMGPENVYNPSFDVTPAELISAVVTEKGVAVRDEEGKIDLGGIV